jgi:hypothetical protein
MSPACNSCLQNASSCSENKCSSQLAQCLVGINDAGTHNCTDLAKCCPLLVASAQSGCVELVTLDNDTACSTLFASAGCP